MAKVHPLIIVGAGGAVRPQKLRSARVTAHFPRAREANPAPEAPPRGRRVSWPRARNRCLNRDDRALSTLKALST